MAPAIFCAMFRLRRYISVHLLSILFLNRTCRNAVSFHGCVDDPTGVIYGIQNCGIWESGITEFGTAELRNCVIGINCGTLILLIVFWLRINTSRYKEGEDFNECSINHLLCTTFN